MFLSKYSSFNNSHFHGQMSQQRPECPVCLTAYDANRHYPIVLSCGHAFCNSCTKGFQNNTGNCPSCRQQFTYRNGFIKAYAFADCIAHLNNREQEHKKLLKQAKEESKNLTQERQRMKDEANNLTSQILLLEVETKAYKTRIRVLEEENMKAVKVLSESEAENKRLTSRLGKMETENRTLTSRSREIEEENRMVKSRLHEVEVENKGLTSRVYEMEAENKMQASRLREMDDETTFIRPKLYELEVTRHHLQDDNKQIANELKAMKDKEEDLKQEIRELKSENRRLNQKTNGLKDRFEDMRETAKNRPKQDDSKPAQRPKAIKEKDVLRHLQNLQVQEPSSSVRMPGTTRGINRKFDQFIGQWKLIKYEKNGIEKKLSDWAFKSNSFEHAPEGATWNWLSEEHSQEISWILTADKATEEKLNRDGKLCGLVEFQRNGSFKWGERTVSVVDNRLTHSISEVKLTYEKW